jgi:hypothetical protein
VPNVGVVFTVTTGRTADDFMESAGRTIFTDNDGRARDVFRTRSAFDSASRQVTIAATATSAGSPAGTVVVFIN